MGIGCDSCNLWYHGTCINLTPASNLFVILVRRIVIVSFSASPCVLGGRWGIIPVYLAPLMGY